MDDFDIDDLDDDELDELVELIMESITEQELEIIELKDQLLDMGSTEAQLATREANSLLARLRS